DVRQLHVENQARGQAGLVGADVLPGRAIGGGAQAVRLQQFAQRLADPRVVIDDEDDVIFHRHDASTVSTGKVKMNVAPPCSFPSAQSRPPCDSTMDREIARPIPMPLSFVVKKASKIFSECAMPGPASLTSTRTTSPLRRAWTLNVLTPGV